MDRITHTTACYTSRGALDGEWMNEETNKQLNNN